MIASIGKDELAAHAAFFLVCSFGAQGVQKVRCEVRPQERIDIKAVYAGKPCENELKHRSWRFVSTIIYFKLLTC